jgi:hypothetical protein
MTYERDFDRVARAWLSLGPDEAPDRAVSAVLEAVASTPQVRRPARWPTWRLFDMNRLPILAGATAVVVVIAGGLLLMDRRTDPSIGAPTTSPSVAPSSSAGAEVPAELRYRWIGEPRDVPPFGEHTRTALDLTSGDYYFTATDLGEQMRSSAAVLPDGTLRLETGDAAVPCDAGDVGVYRYALSPGGTRLSVTADAVDDCASRSAAITGDWIRTACKNEESGCWGELEAGTYPTQYIRPRLDTGEIWEPLLGDMTFTVPEGWANAEDWPTAFRLTPATDYALEDAGGPPEGASHSLLVWARPAANVQDESCAIAVDPNVERTPDALVDWISGLPAIEATTPQDITVDGYPGRWVDIAVAADWTGSCPFVPDGTPAVSLLTEVVPAGEGWAQSIAGEERMRLVFVDLGDGDTVLFMVDSTDPTRFDDLAAASMPIIESFDFN